MSVFSWIASMSPSSSPASIALRSAASAKLDEGEGEGEGVGSVFTRLRCLWSTVLFSLDKDTRCHAG